MSLVTRKRHPFQQFIVLLKDIFPLLQAASSRQELNHEPVGEMVAPPSYEEVMAESSNFTMISQNISLNIN